MSDNPKTIDFDSIHPESKQKNLHQMMEESSAASRKLPNNLSKLTQCPICRSKDLKYYTEKYGYPLDKCLNCLHIFCNPYPDKNQLQLYYNSPMKAFENNFFKTSLESRIPIFDYRIEVIEQYLKSGSLLDVGSAIGIFIEALKRRGSLFDLHCCDPSEDACQHLQATCPNLTIHQCMLEDLEVSGQFDCVTMWDTLEHLQSPHQTAHAIKRLLKPGGYWFFSTPNTSGFEWEIAQKDHLQLLPPGHINLFNIKGIQYLLEHTGFSIVDHQTPNGSLDVSYIKKLLTQNNSAPYRERLGPFLTPLLENDPLFAEHFSVSLSHGKQAGNILVIARVSS